ncbi:MAG: NnrU family protein [Aestuariivirga sp.]|uniref:NnrU family protein n=1 Tax=Aestuariivirga sp. TaxID=2650926 RepID=UPI0038CF347D
MILLAFGVALTAALHLIAAVPPLKSKLKEAVGARAYGPVYGLATLAGLAVVVLGWRMADFVPLYGPPSWGRYANFLLTLIGFICLGIFLFRGSLRQKLRFPMAWAVIFWAAGHLLAAGDLAGTILFGGFAVYALLHMIIGTYYGVRPSPERRGGHDLLAVIAGVALYALMAQLHGVLIGIPVVQLG